MKKLFTLLSILMLAGIISGCDENTSESSNLSNSDSSTGIVDSSLNEMEALIAQELEIINNSPAPTAIRDSIYISKDGTTYYEKLTRKEHDRVHGYHFIYNEEKGLNDLNNSESTYNITSSIYYDGYYSYTLDSDDRYKKVEDEREIKDFDFEFDFSVLEVISVEKKGFSYELTASVSKENTNKFLKTSNKEIEQINFISTSNGGRFLGFEISYVQNGFEVERELQYTYSDIEFELPTNQYIK